MGDRITLDHGSGGVLSWQLIEEVLLPALGCEGEISDGAVIEVPAGAAAVLSTDSHVVKPIFFPGGDLGRLAVTGTANDICVMGARPLYMSCGLIIEEGLPVADLRRVAASMGREAASIGLRLVTGDTKVVERGAADGIFINTTGVGVLMRARLPGVRGLAPGDAVIVSGTVGDHGMAVYAVRHDLGVSPPPESDCACVLPLVERVIAACPGLRIMRDPTRGGLATVLNEFVRNGPLGIEVREKTVPLREDVGAISEMLGLDPMLLACEGKIALVAPENEAESALAALHTHPLGRRASIIGRVTKEHPGRVTLRTAVGGLRLLEPLYSDMLPRIC